MQIVFGIDFGTSNSALSVYRDGQVEVVSVDKVGRSRELMRSVLYFNEEKEIFTGAEAISEYIADGACGRFMQSIKTFLPSTSFSGTEIYGKRYGIDDLIAIILKKLKECGESHVGSRVDSVVLGRPVVFSEDKEKDAAAERYLLKAAKKAGFKNIWFQHEPIAAALAFEASLPAGEERIAFIGDFGGGTSDFSVIRVRGGDQGCKDRRSDVLALGGVYIAGDRFDSQVMWDKVAPYFGRNARYQAFATEDWCDVPTSLVYTLSQWHRIPLLRSRQNRELINTIKRSTDSPQAIQNLENIIEDNYGFALFQAIEKAKCDLSGSDQTAIRFEDVDFSLAEPLCREEFERLNAENFQQIADCIDDVLSQCGLQPEQIDTVSLTGGTSKIPYIQQLFIDRFGRGKADTSNAFTSVAHGMGLSVPLFC